MTEQKDTAQNPPKTKNIAALLQQLALINGGNQNAQEKSQQDYQFWNTQPVTKLGTLHFSPWFRAIRDFWLNLWWNRRSGWIAWTHWTREISGRGSQGTISITGDVWVVRSGPQWRLRDGWIVPIIVGKLCGRCIGHVSIWLFAWNAAMGPTTSWVGGWDPCILSALGSFYFIWCSTVGKNYGMWVFVFLLVESWWLSLRRYPWTCESTIKSCPFVKPTFSVCTKNYGQRDWPLCLLRSWHDAWIRRASFSLFIQLVLGYPLPWLRASKSTGIAL